MICKYPTHCGKCGILTANGIGADDTPELNKFLQSLPSSHLFYEASVGHDLNFHLARTKEDVKRANEIFLKDMLEACKSKPLWQRWFWQIQARRNFWFVDAYGEKFCDFRGCEG